MPCLLCVTSGLAYSCARDHQRQVAEMYIGQGYSERRTFVMMAFTVRAGDGSHSPRSHNFPGALLAQWGRHPLQALTRATTAMHQLKTKNCSNRDSISCSGSAQQLRGSSVLSLFPNTSSSGSSM